MPRELIDTATDKRFVRRDEKGQFDDVVDVGKPLAQDRRRRAKLIVKSGEGDRGDQKPRVRAASARKTTTTKKSASRKTTTTKKAGSRKKTTTQKPASKKAKTAKTRGGRGKAGTARRGKRQIKAKATTRRRRRERRIDWRETRIARPPWS